MRRRSFLLGAAALWARPAAGKELSNIAVLAGDRFSVGEQEFQLADIRAPSEFSLGGATEPYFNEAKTFLTNLIAAAPLSVHHAAPANRWGVELVRAARNGDERSLQHHLIAAGMARVAPESDEFDFIDGLLAAEAAARQAHKGLWAIADYRLFKAEDATGAIGGFHLVEGRVRRAAKVKSRIYLNFGDDYKTDFTASAPTRQHRRWLKQGLDITALEGEKLRLRGFITDFNGPSLELTHLQQIERLE